MYYQTMKTRAREKHERLRREAHTHRMVHKNRGQQGAPVRFAILATTAMAFVDFATTAVKRLAAAFESVGRAIGRFVIDRTSAAHS